MKITKYLAAALLTSTFVSAPMAAIMPVKFEFSQGGFYSYELDQDNNLVQGALTNASITGSFIGKDRNGDGQLYARSELAASLGLGPFGNELIYAEITFNGFGTTAGPQTVVYDATGIDLFGGISDMTSIFSAFMGIAYNLDGGELGDTADEGLSLGLFAPSTNYTIGSLFAPYWNAEEYLGADVTGICDNINLCGLVFEALPAMTASGAELSGPFFLTTETLQMTQVPVPTPTLLGMLLGAFAGLFMLRQVRKA